MTLLTQSSIKSLPTHALQCSVTYSTIAPKAVTTAISSYYDLGQVKNCQFWYHGLSDIYRIETDTGFYIFRVSHHHWRSRSEIQFELEFLSFLRENKIPVASPLPTRTGELCLEIAAPEGVRYGTVFEYAAGSVPIGDLDCTQSHQLGETLAKLHQISYDFSPVSERSMLTPELIIDRSNQIIAPFLEHRPWDLQTLFSIADQVKAELQNLPQTKPFWTVCWGDPHSGNTHFTENNQLTLFDFDQCGYGWRAFDLGKFYQVSLQSGCTPKVREAVLQGYSSISPLRQIEIDCLPSLTVAAFIWAWGIHLNRAICFEYSRLDDHYFTRRLEKLKHLSSRNW
ncbi:putative homoserine kinase type II (protein kinase fold) [Dactylococcopsis salina PCC 8305]|uniref:Homoserine kinase type II (Protein kinase fold) n=1 Tax=Dactylococcopsis salina (strain PCC 8305) TaxID=13035 RepID=K9YRW8_DACS8|nr:putative homoserine kinase type II (protein kinase fold) [Dactylococcopsis salina PCC 8305]